MKNILILFFLFFVSHVISKEKTDVYLLAKGHNEVVARLQSKTENEMIFIALENTTSEIEIVLASELDKVDQYPEGYRAKFCFDIEENCNWSCRGKFVDYIEAVYPWKKLKLKHMLKEVENCGP